MFSPSIYRAGLILVKPITSVHSDTQKSAEPLLEMLCRERPAGVRFQVSLKCDGVGFFSEGNCSLNPPRDELACVRASSGVVNGETFVQIFRPSGVVTPRISQTDEDVHVIELVVHDICLRWPAKA